jgi:hypothetical protein
VKDFGANQQKKGYKKFVDNLKKAGLYVDSKGNNGLSHGVTRAKGTLAEIIKAGTGT